MECLCLSISCNLPRPNPCEQFFIPILEHLSNSNLNAAFEALLGLSEDTLDEKKKEEYMAKMYDIYHDFEMRSVGEQSLTQIMMKTVRCAVEDAGLYLARRRSLIIREH